MWLEILALFVVAALIGSFRSAHRAVAVVVIVLIGTRINALNVVMHEASHGFLFRIGRPTTGSATSARPWWMFHSVEEYRPTHRLHHRYLNGPRTPTGRPT